MQLQSINRLIYQWENSFFFSSETRKNCEQKNITNSATKFLSEVCTIPKSALVLYNIYRHDTDSITYSPAW